jgi:hypothetical protein
MGSVGNRQLRARVGAFLAHDDPHPGRPGGRVEQVGDLGHERPVPHLTVGIQRGCPSVVGDQLERVGEAVGEGEPDRVGQPLSADPVQEGVRGAGGVGADEHPPTRPPPAPVRRQLLERVPRHGDVVGGGIRPGVARPQQHRQRLPGALAPVVDERPQRVEAIAVLVL